MTPELEEKLNILVDAMLENQPRRESDRFFTGDVDTILSGTALTVTFSLNALFVVKVVEVYADARTGCTYAWVINGAAYTLNELQFYKGKPVSGDSIKLIISNTSLISVDVGYYIKGWGDMKTGG